MAMRLENAFRFALYQAGPISIVATTLVVWPVLGRSLPLVQVGSISSVFAAASICAPAVTLGLHLHLANRLARDPSRLRGVEGSLARGAISALLTVGLVLGTALLFRPDSAFLQFGSVIAASSASLIALGVSRGMDRARQYAVLTVLSQFAALAALAAVAAATGSTRGALPAYCAVLLSTAALGLRGVWRASGRSDSTVTAELGHSLRLVPHLVLSVATLLLTRLVVGLLEGNAELAQFQYASLLIGGVTTVGASLDAHWSVRAQSSRNVAELDRNLSRNLRRMLIASIIVIAGVAVFAVFALPIWLPPGYDVRSVRSAVFLAASAGVFQAVADNRAAAMMWSAKTTSVSWSTIAGVTTTLVASILLVDLFGWVAAGAAIAAGSAVRAGVLLVSSPREHRTSVSSVIWVLGALTLSLLPIALVWK